MEIQEYIEAFSSEIPDYLQHIQYETQLEVLNPRMVCGPIEGRLLSMLSRMIAPKRILELGTFTGYSALCLAEGLADGGWLTTIEHNDELEDRIRRNLRLNILGQKVELQIADAIKWLEQDTGTYDLVFIDADKKEYTNYIQRVLPRVREGGWIIADNTLWDGHVIDNSYDKDPQTQGLRNFNEWVRNCPNLECLIVPIRDGLTIMRKIN